jgi:serine/threonine protein kinase/tetratricopeptide (TPR) repeat protein
MSESNRDMKSEPSREEALFQAAAHLAGAERAAFLEAVSASDPALRQRLEALLAAHERTDLATESDTARPTIKLDLADAPDEAVGQTLGRYKLLEKLGEGGCGVVYVAEQTEPVRRRIALKVIKLGMDTKQVVARFEAERQALAMMDHPNIAKVLDAGTTDTGRPYFVMELVRGIRITEYCDQNNLTTKERLDLFIKVCQAIQHAHQKGIIHRDIKPSNFLVTLHDGVPVPKVIDFGIAKATEGRLTDNTVYTQLHQFIGTPAYMSPEQAEMSGLDIDTRSDIYSLGALLYELLAGSTPFDPKELIASGIDAMRKTIREKEPLRPSTRLATLKGEELTSTAKRRSSDVPKLIHLLKGDLDWIVMKCLEKDRTRRYETANGLAADLKRHLANEPVTARPPSLGYKFQKAIRRNKLAFAAAAAVVASLAAGMGVSTWLLLKEREAHKNELAAVQAQLGEQKRASQQQARAEQEGRLRQLGSLTQEVFAQARWAEAEALGREKLALQQKLLGEESLDAADSLVELGAALLAQRKWNEAESTLRKGLMMQRKFLKKGDPRLSGTLMLFVNVLNKQSKWSEAENLGSEMGDLFKGSGLNYSDFGVAARSVRFLPVLQSSGLIPQMSSLSNTNSVHLAIGQVDSLIREGKYDQAEQVFSNHLTPDFVKKPESAPLLKARADFLARRGRWKEAAADFSKLIESDPTDHWLHHSLAPLLAESGDLEGYCRHCAQVLAIFGGNNDPVVAERMAKACLIVPCPGLDLAAVVQLTDTAVTLGKDHEYFVYFQFAKGLAEYRTGNFVNAADLMAKVIAVEGVPSRDAQANLVLAMAQSKLNHREEAAAALAKGTSIFGQMAGPQSGNLGGDWYGWIIAHALLSEAQGLIDPSPKTQSRKE